MTIDIKGHSGCKIDIIEDGVRVLQKTWDNLYKKAMEPMREYLKKNQHKIQII